MKQYVLLMGAVLAMNAPMYAMKEAEVTSGKSSILSADDPASIKKGMQLVTQMFKDVFTKTAPKDVADAEAYLADRMAILEDRIIKTEGRSCWLVCSEKGEVQGFLAVHPFCERAALSVPEHIVIDTVCSGNSAEDKKRVMALLLTTLIAKFPAATRAYVVIGKYNKTTDAELKALSFVPSEFMDDAHRAQESRYQGYEASFDALKKLITPSA